MKKSKLRAIIQSQVAAMAYCASVIYDLEAKLKEACKVRDEWCAEYTKLRDERAASQPQSGKAERARRSSRR